jgi:hypothetical protein
MGSEALSSNTTGLSNIAIGTSALTKNTTGELNTAIGDSAGFNASGSQNIFIGQYAGYNVTGSNNTMIGSYQGPMGTELNNNIIMPASLNTILYGPPGTGKTYNSINKAISIINPDFLLSNNRVKLRDEYKRLENNNQIICFSRFFNSFY